MSRKSLMLAFAGVVALAIVWLLVDFRSGSTTEPSLPIAQPAAQQHYVDSDDSTKNDPASANSLVANVASNPRKAFRMPATLKLPDGALKDSIESLEDQAKMGNAEIAYALSVELHECAMLDSQLADLQENLKSKSTPDETVRAQLNFLDPKVERCAGLSQKQFDSRFMLTKLAADNGNVSAQVTYPAIFSQLILRHALDEAWIRAYKENSMKYLTQAASSGSVDGMHGLAMTYWDGYLVPANKITGFAYMYAANRSGLLPSASKMLVFWSAAMTPEEIATATQRGMAIYNACCH